MEREAARSRGDAIALAVDSDAWRRLSGDYRPRSESLGIFTRTATIRRHRELRRLFFFRASDRAETVNPRVRFVPRDRRERDMVALIERAGDRTVRSIAQTNQNTEEASRAAAREALMAEISRIDREISQYHKNTAAKQAAREVRERLLAAWRALAE
jgi:bifunctional ADP-heptose synthase (sugar kinase/adenylyltransferase)